MGPVSNDADAAADRSAPAPLGVHAAVHTYWVSGASAGPAYSIWVLAAEAWSSESHTALPSAVLTCGVVVVVAAGVVCLRE